MTKLSQEIQFLNAIASTADEAAMQIVGKLSYFELLDLNPSALRLYQRATKKRRKQAERDGEFLLNRAKEAHNARLRAAAQQSALSS